MGSTMRLKRELGMGLERVEPLAMLLSRNKKDKSKESKQRVHPVNTWKEEGRGWASFWGREQHQGTRFSLGLGRLDS